MLNPTVLARRAPTRLVLLLFVFVVGSLSAARAQTTYSQIIVFGDSLSDTGNDADVSDDSLPFGRIPGSSFGYTDGRFTSGSDTSPASALHGGVWHEQLAKLFLGMPAAKASLDGGMDYAYGGATTEMGTSKLDFSSGVGITVNNMGKQVNDYLSGQTPDPDALYIVWGGANDIFVSERSAAGLIATGNAAADRETLLIQRLAQAGAVTFLVPNLPPIGDTPRYNISAGDIAAYNAACEAFSSRLNDNLTGITANLADQGVTIKIYRLDVFGLFQRLLANQQAYNFYNITQSSQGESVKADNYLFWDDVHPTASGHYQLAVEAYTVLTGKPVIQIAPSFAADGFFVTRSGTDVSTTLSVPYTVTGKAVAGTDYVTLKGHKNLKAGKQTVRINAPAIDGTAANGKSVAIHIVDGGDAFGVGTVLKAKITYGNPIMTTNAIHGEPATRTEYARQHSLIVPANAR